MRALSSLTAALVTALVVGAALALAGGDETQESASSSNKDRLAVDAVAPGLPALVAAFRRSQEEQDRIPGGDPNKALEQTGDALPGENPRMARRLVLGDGSEAYVWPMSDGACFSWSLSAVCARTARLEERGLLLGFGYTDDGPRWDVFALVRDGIEEIRFTLADGRGITRQVRDNAVRLISRSQPVQLEWRQPDGTSEHVEIPRR